MGASGSLHRRRHLYSLLALLSLACAAAQAAVVVRQEVEPGVHAAVRNGELLILECRIPEGPAVQQLLSKYLANPSEWEQYRKAKTVAIRFDKLNPAAQRRVLEKLFPDDYVDQSGWWHTVAFEDNQRESLPALAAWFTGDARRAGDIRKANQSIREPLQKGQKLLVPASLLNETMRVFTPKPPPLVVEEKPRFEIAASDLEYSRDAQGDIAVYRLKPGEAMYSSVVVRFTDLQENADIHQALKVIASRTGLADANKVKSGQKILIPLDLLSDRYQPEGSEKRQNYEEVRQEAKILQAQRVRTHDLEGVVVVLDPGHGGRDHGACDAASGLYEDELTYDIVARIKNILESETEARVYATMLDPDQNYTTTNAARFAHDTDELLLTTPTYHNMDARISANLRWYLANRIYRQELKKGTDEKKMLFLSVHCDALFNGDLRGAMVYVPGADYRRDREEPGGVVYAAYQEVKEQRFVTTTAANRRRDEAMSRNFADILLNSLRNSDPPIKVHDTGDPIRNVIRQSGGVAYVPAVLRNTLIPTKVLLETANLTNAQDRERLADPQWRQWMAEACVQAIRVQFGAAPEPKPMLEPAVPLPQPQVAKKATPARTARRK